MTYRATSERTPPRGITMHRICCPADVPLARKVKIRRIGAFDPAAGKPDSATYKSHIKEMI
jgi:hypothetical protein